MNRTCLGRWRGIDDREDGLVEAGSGSSSQWLAADEAELRELRRCNRPLEQENEILRRGRRPTSPRDALLGKESGERSLRTAPLL